MKKINLLIALSLCLFNLSTQAQNYTVLHTFTPSTCSYPRGNLVLSGSHLYGTANTGGANNGGCIFTVDTNGNGYRDLYDFTIKACTPEGSIILIGNKLYGTVSTGGEYVYTGGIYYIDTDGTGFALMHSFGGPNHDGTSPVGQLTNIGNTLFGVTEEGGTTGDGTVYSIQTDSSNYKILYNFAGGTDGSNPVTSLAVSGKSLYGITQSGGASSEGSIFKIDSNGANYSLLYSFSGLAYSFTTPLIIGNTIYSTMELGGIGLGSIYTVKTDGSNYKTIYSSGSNTPNGFEGDLLLMGATIYGVCPNSNSQSSSDAAGSVFTIDSNAVTANTVFYFTDSTGTYPGKDPFGGLINRGSTLFGTTTTGGSQQSGVVFKFNGTAPTGISNLAQLQDKVNVYPNPAQNQLNLAVTGLAEASKVEIYDITGKAMGTYNILNNFLTINTQSYSTGLYIYKLLDDNGVQLKVGKFDS